MSKKTDTLPPTPVVDVIVIDDSPEGIAKLRDAGFTVTTDTNPGVILCTDAANPVRLLNGDSVQHMAGGVYVTKKAPNA